MKQLRQISILVRGAQLLLLVLALFLVVWLVPDAGKKHASGTEASEAETDGGDVAENEKNGAAGNLEDDGSSAGEVIQDDADENASDVEAALKRRISRKQLYKRKKEFQKAQEETVYMPPTIWLATDLHYQSPQMTDFQSAFDTYTMGNDGTIVPYLDEITEAFLEEVRTAHPSALVLSGDLSQNGEKANHEALAEKLERVQAAGIPAYSTSKTGYFSTQEIVTVLNYLHLCDNPCQEIPFTAILRSPICGCTDAELAAVRCVDKDVKIYEACGKYAAIGEDEALREKLRRFLTQLEMLRSRVPYTPIHELITQILEETGYGGYASAMPGGVQRRANLEMLVEKAVEFEATSYRGLFNFIRYIEQLQKYEVDFGEVNIYGESADTVRIMSIHKSKGLEFPVVFLSGMGKSFNQMDSRAVLVLHSRMGIGADAIDPENRVRQATLPRQIIRQSMKLENLAEELRVLYVAMTRPKEKLIMTGMASKLESRVKQCAAHAGRQEELLSYQTLSSASGYLDWILPAFSRNRCFDGLYEQFGLAGNAENPLYAEKIPVTIRLVSPAGLVEGEVLHQMERAVNEQKIMKIPKQPPREEALKELVEERFSYQYPYEDEKQIPVKVTVSQLKKAGMEESEIGKELFVQEEFVPIVPGFMKKDNAEALTGADRGTAYHRLLECLDYRRAYSIKELMAQTEELVAEGKMTKEAAECIYFKSVLAFAKSPVGMRMRNAFLNETLKREQPFVMSVPASEADPSYPEDETILVQGIIDAWFPEGDEIVLVDYKTDRVKEAGELKKRYEKQLAYYQQALERTTGKKVKEKIIYSLALDEELVL